MGGQLPIEDSLPYHPDVNVDRRVAVHVPPDPKGVLDAGHGVRDLLANDTLIIVRCVLLRSAQLTGRKDRIKERG